MKQVKVSLLLLALALLLAGCGVSDQDLLDSIPTMTIDAGRYRYQIAAGGYDWTTTDRFGGSTSAITDAAHPLQVIDDLMEVDLTGGEQAALRFSRTPDAVEVTYWSAGDSVGSDGTTLETAFLDDAFLFTAPEAEGQLVFQVTARWTSYEDVSGTVSYPFVTPAPAEE